LIDFYRVEALNVFHAHIKTVDFCVFKKRKGNNMKTARLAIVGSGFISTIIIALFVSSVVSLSQTNTDNSNSNSDKIAPFEATAQLMNALQYGGDAKSIKLLIAKGADVNAKDNEGWHALQLAAKRGNIEIVRLLLENGADVNATNLNGVTALTSAAYRGYTDIAKLFVEKGASVNAKENDNTTALMVAAGAGQTNAVEFLLDNGADINATNNFGYSVLMTALNGNKIDVVKILLSKGVKINETNWSGETVLMSAVEDGKTEIVKLLLAKGAKVNAENFLGRSALDEAKQKGDAAIVQLLQQAGATKSSSVKQDEEMTKDLKELQESSDAISNSLRNLQQPAAVPVTFSVSVPEKPVKPAFVFGTNADSAGYVTNAALLTPFTLTNTAGDVITNAVLSKLTANKFIYKTPSGGMGMLPLGSLPEDLLKKIGYDPQAAQAADDAENQKKAREQELAQQQRAFAAQQATLYSQNRTAVLDVSGAIKSYAEKKWPGEYDMQKYEIDKQTEAYNWVATSTSASGVPQDVFAQIKTSAVNKWPDEYDMQKYEIEKQVKAYVELH
jgi:ankyrin repeat protein